MSTGEDYKEIGKEVIDIEIAGLCRLKSKLNSSFDDAVSLILKTKGRIVITGVGKSGIIARKISASLASTGTHSFFMHPSEAIHGDLGMANENDIFIALSYSGETEEVLKLIPFVAHTGNILISMTGNADSKLAKSSDCHLDVSVEKEACPLQLAPTASTTNTLVMGDALVVALMRARRFMPEDFARYHPGGALGKKLLHKVCDHMVIKDLPIISEMCKCERVISAITKGAHGLAIVMKGNKLKGIITDGDLRRAINQFGKDVFDKNAFEIMTKNPLKIEPERKLVEALEMMANKKVQALLVVRDEELIGIIKNT